MDLGSPNICSLPLLRSGVWNMQVITQSYRKFWCTYHLLLLKMFCHICSKSFLKNTSLQRWIRLLVCSHFRSFLKVVIMNLVLFFLNVLTLSYFKLYNNLTYVLLYCLATFVFWPVFNYFNFVTLSFIHLFWLGAIPLWRIAPSLPLGIIEVTSNYF